MFQSTMQHTCENVKPLNTGQKLKLYQEKLYMFMVSIIISSPNTP